MQMHNTAEQQILKPDYNYKINMKSSEFENLKTMLD